MPPPDHVQGQAIDPRASTRPESPSPPDPIIEAAMRDVPRVLADMENTRDYYAPHPPPGQRIVLNRRLVRELGDRYRHGKAVSEWAIHRLVDGGFLRARLAQSDWPSSLSRDGTWQGGGRYEVAELGSRLIGSTERLWEWWREMENSRSEALREDHLAFLEALAATQRAEEERLLRESDHYARRERLRKVLCDDIPSQAEDSKEKRAGQFAER